MSSIDQRLGFGKPVEIKRRPPVALLPVHVAETRTDARRREPVTVLLRNGHMIKSAATSTRARSPRRRAAGAGLILGLPPSVHIYFAAALVDMRKCSRPDWMMAS